MRPTHALLLLAFCAAPLLQAGLAQAADSCPVPADVLPQRYDLPRARAAATGSEKKLNILVLGSAPTEGMAAGGAGHAYPAMMQAQLQKVLPGVQINVTNRGVAGRSTRRMLDRIPEEIANKSATLVIWETGGRELARHLEVDAYAGDVQDGVARIHDSGADVILLDLQYIPDSLGLSDPAAYRQALRDAANTDDTALFPRFDLMHFWAKSGLIDLDARDSGRRVQSARTLFACLGDALGSVIGASLR